MIAYVVFFMPIDVSASIARFIIQYPLLQSRLHLRLLLINHILSSLTCIPVLFITAE